MTLIITIPPDLEERLKGQAANRGEDPAEYARRLIERGLGPPPAGAVRDNRASLDVLDRWEQQTAPADAADASRRNAEFEAFKEAMNRNRLESEGPDGRKVYP
jgi:hypothetical protein